MNKPTQFLISILALGMAGSAFGQHLWTGTESEDWFDADNWNGGVPNAGTSQVRINNPNPAEIDGQAAETGSGFSVGHNAEGELSIINGGSLHTHGSATLGSQAAGNGSVTISGTGSSWEIESSSSDIGDFGVGEIEILDGGQWIGPDSGTISIGRQASGSGSVTVSGAGSSMEFGGNFWLGHTGTGQMTISDGGQVTFNQTSTVAQAGNSQGEILLTGAGSLLSGNRLNVGNSSSGYMRLVDGATLHLTGPGLPDNYRLVIGHNSGSEGEVVVGGPAGEAPEAPGQLDLFGGILFNGGAGTLVFNHTGALNLPFPIEGPVGANASAEILVENGDNLFTGEDFNYTGPLEIAAGASFGAPGQLGPVTNLGRFVVAPGQTSTVEIEGDYTHGSDAILEFSVGPGAQPEDGPQADLLDITGQVDLQGGEIALTFLPGDYGSEPLDGTIFPVLTAAAGIIGDIDDFEPSNPNAFILFQDGDTLYVEIFDSIFRDRLEAAAP